MFFEELSKADLEGFIGYEVYSVTDLERTSYATNAESLYLIKAVKNGKLIRYYANDLICYNAQDVYYPLDNSIMWQGFILSKLQNTEYYDKYVSLLESFYTKKHTKRSGSNFIRDEEKIREDLSVVFKYKQMYLNGDESETEVK